MGIEQPPQPSVNNESNSRFSEFIKNRNIHTEDIPLLEELESFPKSMVVQELHNLFNMYKEQSIPELMRLKSVIADTDPRERLYSIFLDLSERYDWMTLYNLVRVLER